MQRWILSLIIVASFVGCGRVTDSDNQITESPTSTETSAISIGAPTTDEVSALDLLAKANFVRIVTEKGNIDLELYPDDAPVHVANFLKLIRAGFYDGLTFHRVESEFVIQGGDPAGNGTGGPGYTINAEFNSRQHLTGTLAMARTGDPNSAGSQFYITLAPQPFLDGKYTVFGQTVAGLDVISKISRDDIIQKIEIFSK